MIENDIDQQPQEIQSELEEQLKKERSQKKLDTLKYKKELQALKIEIETGKVENENSALQMSALQECTKNQQLELQKIKTQFDQLQEVNTSLLEQLNTKDSSNESLEQLQEYKEQLQQSTIQSLLQKSQQIEGLEAIINQHRDQTQNSSLQDQLISKLGVDKETLSQQNQKLIIHIGQMETQILSNKENLAQLIGAEQQLHAQILKDLHKEYQLKIDKILGELVSLEENQRIQEGVQFQIDQKQNLEMQNQQVISDQSQLRMKESYQELLVAHQSLTKSQEKDAIYTNERVALQEEISNAKQDYERIYSKYEDLIKKKNENVKESQRLTQDNIDLCSKIELMDQHFNIKDEEQNQKLQKQQFQIEELSSSNTSKVHFQREIDRLTNENIQIKDQMNQLHKKRDNSDSSLQSKIEDLAFQVQVLQKKRIQYETIISEFNETNINNKNLKGKKPQKGTNFLSPYSSQTSLQSESDFDQIQSEREIYEKQLKSFRLQLQNQETTQMEMNEMFKLMVCEKQQLLDQINKLKHK